MRTCHNKHDLADKFVEIVNQVTEMDDNEKARARIFCPDQSVGLIKEACAPGEFNRVDIYDGYRGYNNAEGRVILILESPHEREYVYSSGKWVAVGPAQGCTGCSIRNKFRKIFSGSVSVDRYELILVNAIQYQCSLGRALNGKGNFSRIKNLIVQKTLSENAFQEDLAKRIDAVFRIDSQDFIVNASSSDTAICCAVNSVLRGMTTRVICGVPHPFSWRYAKKLEKARDVVTAAGFLRRKN